MSGCSHSALISLGVFYATSAGMSLAGASAFVTATLVGAAIFALPIGRLSDHVDRRRVLAVTGWAATLVAVGALIARTGDWAVLVVLGGALGAVTFALYPLSLAHLNDRLRPDEVVDAGAKLVLVDAAGAVFGPVSATTAMAITGPNGFWWHQAILHGALAVYATYRLTQLAPLEVRSDFAPLPSGATPAIIVAPDPSTPRPIGETEHPVEVPDLTLITHVAGHGEPFVLLHGLGASSAVWLHLRRALTRLGHTVFASGQPDEVRSLTIMSWAGALPPRGRVDHTLRATSTLADRTLSTVGGQGLLARRLAAPFYDPRVHPDRYELLRDAAMNTSPRALSAAVHDLVARPLHRTPPHLPALGIVGANDPTVTSAMLAELHDWVEVAGIEVIPHAGRFPQLDNPSEVLARLHDFVSRVAGRDGPSAG